MIKSLSVFFPAYNEQENIKNTILKAYSVLKELKIPWELIVVDDGSKDKTSEIVNELSTKIPELGLVSQENGGYGKALRTGFLKSKNEWVVYTDSDGQFDFKEVRKFLDLADDYDAIWGYRLKRNDPKFRLLLAKIWNLSVRFLLGIKLRDTDCGFKMVKKSCINKILPLISTRGAMINAEIPFKLKKHGYKIGEVGVNHYPRVGGKPTGANFAVALKSYLELIKLWWSR